MESTKTRNPIITLPIAMLVMAMAIMLMARVAVFLDDISSGPPAVDSWELKELRMPYNMAALDTAEFIPIRGVQFPSPPDCNELGKLVCRVDATEKPAEYESDDGHVIDVTVKAGGRKIGQGQLMEIPSSYADELIPAQPYADTVWIEYIGVSRFLWGNGFGRWIFTALNKALLHIVELEGGTYAVRVLVDQAGWGPNLMKSIPPEDIISAVDGVYIFFVR